jgi:hypothetical protein
MYNMFGGVDVSGGEKSCKEKGEQIDVERSRDA